MGDWKSEARERVKEKLQGNTFKLLDGQNIFRVLPNKKGVQFAPYIEGLVHRDVGPDKGFTGCGHDIEGGGKCWLCDAVIPTLEKSGLPEKRALAAQIGPKTVFIVQVSRIDKETGKFGPPKPFWVSTGKGIPGQTSTTHPPLSVQVESLLVSDRRSYDDPVKGFNMIITRHGTGPGKGTRYDAPDHEDSPSKVPTAVLALIKPLKEFLPVYDIEDQKSLYYGRPRPDQMESPRAPASASPSRRPAPAAEPEEQFSEDGDSAEASEEMAFEDAPPEEFVEEPTETEVETEVDVLEEPEFEDAPEPEEQIEEFEPEPLEEPEPAPPPRRAAKQAPPAPKPMPKPVPAPARKVAPAPARRK